MIVRFQVQRERQAIYERWCALGDDRPPVEEMNSQWSTFEITLIKNGGILSTFRIA